MRLLTVVAASCGLALLFSGWTEPGVPSAEGRFARWVNRRHLATRQAIRLFAVSAVAGAGAALLALAATGLISVAALAALVTVPWPFARMKARRARTRAEVSEAWPDALSSVIAGIRAGMSLPECCCALAERGPASLRPGFRAFAVTYRSCMSFDAALGRLRDVLQDPIADRVMMVLGLASSVGGSDLVRVLRATSDFIREDLRTRGEVRARWSWTVNAARLAAGTPFAVLVVMGLRPEARLAYGTSGGMTTVAIGTLVTLVGYRLMLRAAHLPEDRRLG